MPSSRILLSIIAFLAAVMLIWLLVTLGALEPIKFAVLGPMALSYFGAVAMIYSFFWIYFFRRPRGSKTVVDGRAALSVCAFIVGGTTAYLLIDLGILIPWHRSELGSGSFTAFFAFTALPIVAWLAVFLHSRRRRNTVQQSGVER